MFSINQEPVSGCRYDTQPVKEIDSDFKNFNRIVGELFRRSTLKVRSHFAKEEGAYWPILVIFLGRNSYLDDILHVCRAIWKNNFQRFGSPLTELSYTAPSALLTSCSSSIHFQKHA